MQLENRARRSSLIKKTQVTMKEQNHYQTYTYSHRISLYQFESPCNSRLDLVNVKKFGSNDR